jgi:large subunit ribosomal protein L32e
MVVVAGKKFKIVKKRTKCFKRHQSDRYKKIKVRGGFLAFSYFIVNVSFLQESWRRPKGIDNRVRRRFKGQLPMPKIGYGDAKATRHMLPNGMRKLLVKNPRVRFVFILLCLISHLYCRISSCC